MIESRYPQLKKMAQFVISRAEKIKAIENGGPDAFNLSDPSAVAHITVLEHKEKPVKDEIMKYLFDFSDEYVGGLLTLMYVGRDHDCYSNYNSPEEEFNDKMNEIGANTWDSKESIEQMLSKGIHLADYLKNGLKVLKM